MSTPLTRVNNKDYQEVVTFGSILDDAGVFTSRIDLLEYFEKPHKWEKEYEEWVRLDKPTTDREHQWQAFLNAIEDL